jgi:hypothetical protein
MIRPNYSGDRSCPTITQNVATINVIQAIAMPFTGDKNPGFDNKPMNRLVAAPPPPKNSPTPSPVRWGGINPNVHGKVLLVNRLRAIPSSIASSIAMPGLWINPIKPKPMAAEMILRSKVSGFPLCTANFPAGKAAIAIVMNKIPTKVGGVTPGTWAFNTLGNSSTANRTLRVVANPNPKIAPKLIGEI